MTRSLTCVLLAALAAFAMPSGASADDPKIPFERYNLSNGLEVILHQDNRVPLVAVNVWYHVASGDETLGKSGFAHLFEHMLFQGSKHVGEDRHFALLKQIGGSSINGTTNTDRTNYFEVVPSHQIETALWIESDRMGYLLPQLTKKSLDNQIEVVRNERRQSYDNRPYGKARFALHEALYPEGHPYRYMTIGKHTDLESANLKDVTRFYKQWYMPANATLAIAGDFEIAAMKELVEKWFGSFPKSVRPEHNPAPMPVIKRTRTQVEDPFAKLRQVTYAWHTPGYYAPGDAEFDVLSSALARRGTGRLYKILVDEKQLAQRVSANQSSRGFSSYFSVSVTAKTDANLAEIERIVNEEIERVRTEPITDREYKRVAVQQEARFVWGLERLMSRVNFLQQYNHFVGTPDYITQDLDRIRKSSPAEVRNFAAKYLDPNRRVEILTVPVKTSGGK